ncbi:fumarylacetoacetate hydrolase family protein [Vulgatibacter incomptus]|uniref:Fumarylacetoacetate hydrolase family protein n=1 Tax=Vulgatibacter incomptus TaxID=1391653 RepID=A0A0K1PE34_9BACT|nr:fumarylacetoacetate hydrolase family protein [Vulgatibacter incomptus]AKU91770.1 Fumarylacetoacetate hydrolase family protein [Vulgatibacter incomptus]
MNRIVRFDEGGALHYGRVRDGNEVEVLTAAPWSGGVSAGRRTQLGGLELVAPCEPTKVVCVGRNYAAHAKELGNALPQEPLIFLKPASSVIGPEACIILPAVSSDVQHEAELALVIGKRCRAVSAEDAPSYVAGFTCLNDVTARDIQRSETQFTRAKGFDTFCPIGPWIVEGWSDPSNLGVRCLVDGEVRQDGNTGDMVFGPAELLSFISHVMTLEPGDVIATGTPAGVARLTAGQRVEVVIDGIGALANPVV